MSPADQLLLAVEEAAHRGGFALDPAQRAIAQRIVRAASRPERVAPGGGVYVHGPAGRGKSWLADTIFAALPPGRATRVHIHGFFGDLHRRIRIHRGSPDATARAIEDVLGQSRVLFFDELHVHDPGDAALLTRLLERLLESGRTLVATSNYAPEQLLPDPVWHHLFEPGIALITRHLDVCLLDGATDYRALPPRSREGFRAGVWSTSAGPAPTSARHRLVVGERAFAVTSAAEDSLTATFDQLCDAPLAVAEYRHWSRVYREWTLTGVPPLDEVGPVAQQRFVNLIDVLVDADVRLDVSSSVDLDEFLRRTGERPDAFRMRSRLRMLRRA